jgi:hypothetical protein
MTPLQEQALRALARKHRAQQKQASTKLARHVISEKAMEAINARQEQELISLVRGMLRSSQRACTPSAQHGAD